MDQALESRKLGGYFNKVISVHPLAGLFEEGDRRFGSPEISKLDDSHIFIEGKIGISRKWRFVPAISLILAQIGLIKLLIRMARETKIDVVRIGDPYYLGLMGLFLSKYMKVPLAIRICFRYDEISRITGKAVFARLFRFRWVEKIIERFVLARCDLVAGANEDNMRYALENGARADAATVFRYGNLIHKDHWQEPHMRACANEHLAEIGLTGEKFIATVARLEPMKCVEDFIRVVAELSRRKHFIKGLIVGDGASRKELEALAESLNIGDSLVFVGNRNQEWIAGVLPKATAIASTHMGRALTEAALAGVPIVAYDYDWQREVVVDGQTGYLVANKDWMALSDKIEYILADPLRGKQMGENARVKMLKMMDRKILELHEQNEYSRMINRFSSRKKP